MRTNNKVQRNPFQIHSPEGMAASDVVSLFVKVYTDFPKIIDPGHVFLIGPRGSGKSMMFRYLMPDCQCLAEECEVKDLPFLGIYIPLKNTNFTLAELHRLDNKHASAVLNSHILTAHFALLMFNMLKEQTKAFKAKFGLEPTKVICHDVFVPLVRAASWDSAFDIPKQFLATTEVFEEMEKVCRGLYTQVMRYVKGLSFRQDIIPYEGALCDYLDFLYPLLSALRDLPYLPRGPIYMLIDDAYMLSPTQAAVLNSWVATRTSARVSLKISTQPGYGTYYTTSGTTVDTPHDFSEVNISTIYTGSQKNKYRERVTDIVKRRLKLAGIEVSPLDFFPEDIAQEVALRKISEEYRAENRAGGGRGGCRPSDDVVRYARPDYIKSLAGAHKASHSYSYAGFDQLVHLSSGIIRFFLEPAHRMFSEAVPKYSGKPIKGIPPGIQSDVARSEAAKFLFDDLERIEKDKLGVAPPKEMVRNTHLIVLVGYEHERAARLIEILEPSSVSLGYGRSSTATTDKDKDANELFHQLVERVAASFAKVDSFEIMCNDPIQTRDAILSAAKKARGCNIVLAPMNNKMSTIGAALAVFVREEIQVCYAPVLSYNFARYSSPGTTCYLFDLPELFQKTSS